MSLRHRDAPVGSMLSPLDDHLIHQTPDPIARAWVRDPRVFDRHWMVLHDDVGDVAVAIGGSFYANLDTAEAYVIVNHQGDHRSVRAFRTLGLDRIDLHVGPIKPTIVEGLRTWRLQLAPNEWGIELDLLWHDTHRQVYGAQWGNLQEASPHGRTRHVTAGFEGFGTATGWFSLDGQRREVSLRGTRDRHWGVGRGVGGPALNDGVMPQPGWMGGNWVAFDDFAIWGKTVLYPLDDPRPGRGRVLHVQRRLAFDPDTRIFREGEIDYTFEDGSELTMSYERLGHQVLFMRCGLYGGTLGGRYQGEVVADGEEVVVEGDRFDVSDPAVVMRLRGLDEHHCRVVAGDQATTGILQPVDPDAYDACVAGLPGWSLLDR